MDLTPNNRTNHFKLIVVYVLMIGGVLLAYLAIRRYGEGNSLTITTLGILGNCLPQTVARTVRGYCTVSVTVVVCMIDPEAPVTVMV